MPTFVLILQASRELSRPGSDPDDLARWPCGKLDKLDSL